MIFYPKPLAAIAIALPMLETAAFMNGTDLAQQTPVIMPLGSNAPADDEPASDHPANPVTAPLQAATTTSTVSVSVGFALAWNGSKPQS